jgi:tRNA dimethylallyltransferase
MAIGSLPDAPIFLVGATGTGKSAAALELARKYGAAILAMDAMQVYRGADIGTSKPTAADRAEVPHGGLDLVEFGASAHVRFDVAQYLKHAAAFLREQREAGRRVIMVGGTGLYFRALTRGLCEAPQGSDELRRELSTLSVVKLRERLKAIDPAMLERLDAANPRRLARAIEVKEATGRSLRDWQEETPEPLVSDFTAFWIQREKAELEARIEARVEAMFAAGWVEEVRGLAGRYGLDAVRSFPGIGYGEIGAAMELRGQVRSQVQLGNEETVKRDILVATRQYAKRQLTWFARKPNLQAVMLTGNQSLSGALPALS